MPMTKPTAQAATIDGHEIEYWLSGVGEPVVFVHGSMGDETFAMFDQPSLAEYFRVLHYHRRGFGRSQASEVPMTSVQAAANCKALMRQLRINKAHFVGQSLGGLIALQLALDEPTMVQSLALLEPALPSVLLNSPEMAAATAPAGPLLEAGDIGGAIEVFARAVAGDDYRRALDRHLPAGWFDRWVADGDAVFGSDREIQGSFVFTAAEAARISQPVLNAVGADSASYFRQIHEEVQRLLPNAERFEVPDSTHPMLQMNPTSITERLAAFFSSHPM
jgi:pimeloyl-ACP methyl ester carboxylesterase